jgi:hypothetical protein
VCERVRASERERERLHTHTHTHTHIERERESIHRYTMVVPRGVRMQTTSDLDPASVSNLVSIPHLNSACMPMTNCAKKKRDSGFRFRG